MDTFDRCPAHAAATSVGGAMSDIRLSQNVVSKSACIRFLSVSLQKQKAREAGPSGLLDGPDVDQQGAAAGRLVGFERRESGEAGASAFEQFIDGDRTDRTRDKPT
jgi:hypothetical protein